MEIKQERFHTEEEYESIDSKGLVEYDNGRIIMMAPPSTKHQEITGELFRLISNYLVCKTCRAYISPFNVRLEIEKQDVKRIEPDVSVICDRNKITPKGCEGAPDFIIEVVSKGNKMHDYITKAGWYRQAGVKEYWIVDYFKEIILVYLFLEDEFFEYTFEDNIPINIFNGECSIDFTKVVFSKF